MKLHHYFDDISFFPFKRELKGYALRDFHKDLTAAISVALLTLPQAMAYALVAGLPLSTGLFAAIFSSLVAAIFGSSRHLVVGPSNAIAILIQYGTAEILYHHYRDISGVGREIVAFQVMTQLTFLVALIHLLAAGFKLGRLTQFVSYSVVVGYVVGCASAIIINQLFVFLGISSMEGVHSLYAKAVYLITHLNEIHWLTFTVGLGSLILLLGIKRWKKKIPAALVTYVLITAVLFAFQTFIGKETLNVKLIQDAGEITALTPKLMIPHFNFSIMNNLLPIAFAVALLSILETSAVAKSVASSSGQRLSINQEILGLGLGNFASALCGAMPVSGSTSRTTLNYESGARTRVAAIFGAVMVGLVLLVFEDFVAHIPLAALSALMLVTARNLVKKRKLQLCLKATRSDAFVFWLTFLSCVFFSIDVAFYIGVCMSITLFLKKSAMPQVLQYMIDETGHAKSLEFCTPEETAQIRFIKVKGELFFGAADLFQTTLKSIAEDDTNTRVIILQLKNARDIDATACLALEQLHDSLRSSGRYLILSGLTLPVWEIMSNSGLVRVMGKENMFIFDERQPNQYYKRAVNRARELAKLEIKEIEEREEIEVSSLEVDPKPATV